MKTPVRHEYILERKGKHAVKAMCEALDVSESGYYRWLRHRGQMSGRQLLSIGIKKILEEHPDNDNLRKEDKMAKEKITLLYEKLIPDSRFARCTFWSLLYTSLSL